MHRCEHLVELILILDVAQASLEPQDCVVHRFIVGGMVVSAPSIFLCLVIKMLFLLSQDLVQSL